MNIEESAADMIFRFPNQAFPDDGEVAAAEAHREEDKVVQWRDLPQNTWFRIVHQQNINTEYGIVKILHLLHRDDTVCKAWSTAIISKEIDDLQWKREEQKRVEALPPVHLYVKSLGKKASKSNPTRSYYNFKLTYL